METTVASAKPLRVDAERRRRALLCAAATVFLADGLNAPLENVAREAGVGIATLYRRFPTRDNLVEAVFEAKMAAYADRAEAAVDQALDAPWEALADYVREMSRRQADDPAFGAALLRPEQDSGLFAVAHRRARRATRKLIARARDAGAVRTDLRETDVYLLLAATAAVVSTPGPLPAESAARRMAELFLEGVRDVP